MVRAVSGRCTHTVRGGGIARRSVESGQVGATVYDASHEEAVAHDTRPTQMSRLTLCSS